MNRQVKQIIGQLIYNNIPYKIFYIEKILYVSSPDEEIWWFTFDGNAISVLWGYNYAQIVSIKNIKDSLKEYEEETNYYKR